jgi:hypothetical protein
MNTTKSKLIQRLLIFVLPFLFTTFVWATPSPPHFGEGAMILPLSDILDINGLDNDHKYVLFGAQVELSANGNFVLFHWSGWRDLRQSFHLWDLRDIDSYMPMELTPSVSNPSGTESVALFAISPDEQYVVVKTMEELQLYTLPGLELEQTLDLYGCPSSVGILDWSDDSSLVAVIIGNNQTIVVWDIVSNSTYSQEIDRQVWDRWWGCDNRIHLTASNNGWLMKSIYSETDWDFTFCDLFLANCELYSLSEDTSRYTRASANGNTILSVLPSEDYSTRITRVWSFENGSYVLEEEPLAIDELEFPSYLSPSGQYLISHHEKEGAIWDFETRTRVQTLSNTSQLLWLPDEDYFVRLESGTILRLYRLGQNELIEELDLASIYPIEFEDIPDPSIVHSISQDGRRVLIHFGSVLFVVPIEYE